MSRLANAVLIVSIAALNVGCGPAPPNAEPPNAEPPRNTKNTKDPASPAAPGGSPKDAACRDARDAERLTVTAGQAATTRSGVTILFSGATHDSYDDGRTDLLLMLEISGTGGPTSPWMLSAFATPAYYAFGHFCVRITDSSERQVVVDVAPLPIASPRGDEPD
jgi:hypothetical protein